MLVGVEQCGYTGLTEQQCLEEWNCCYDPKSDISCFKPKPISTTLHPGITAGAAVAAFLVCFGLVAGGILYVRSYGLALPNSVTTDSFATQFSENPKRDIEMTIDDEVITA